MPQTTNEIRCAYSDPGINSLLSAIPDRETAISRHYNQVEEFFIKLEREFVVPQLPIHHDVRLSQPEKDYLIRLKEVLEQLIALSPQLFRELTYLFDPAETLKPNFFKLYRIEEKQYLYLLRLDLSYRPHSQRVLVKGSNDFTPAYTTRELFLEAIFIPLEQVEVSSGRIQRFLIDQTISNTWVDETGRGYLIQGIWIDNDLTKFFSKLFVPPGKKIYPFYPYMCKYKTICQNVIRLSPEMRKTFLPLLHRAYGFLRPVMPQIEASLKGSEFTEGNETFRRLKEKVPDAWYRIWEGLKVEVYLNEQDMREFRIEDSPG